MLDIFILVPTFLPPHPPISPSINEVRSMAMSNVDEVTPNHLLQQMYGIQVLDEHVDLELSDEELELIAETPPICTDKPCVVSKESDVIVDGKQIISLDSVRKYENDQSELIKYIKKAFSDANIPIEDIAAQELSQHLRDEAPRVVKRQHRGFKIKVTNPYAGKTCYLDQECNVKF